METVKLKLVKRHNKRNPGDVIEVRPGDARVLKAVGVAEDYVEPIPSSRATGRTATRVMQPGTMTTELPVVEPTGNSSSSSTEIEATSGFGRQPYNRRDMQPEE